MGLCASVRRAIDDKVEFQLFKKTILLMLSVIIFLTACQDSEIVAPADRQGNDADLTTEVSPNWKAEGLTSATVKKQRVAGRVNNVNYIFGVQGGTVWKFNLSTNTSAAISYNGLGGTQGMTFGNGFLFIVNGDVLYKMNAVCIACWNLADGMERMA
jgi:hypothetical protein